MAIAAAPSMRPVAAGQPASDADIRGDMRTVDAMRDSAPVAPASASANAPASGNDTGAGRVTAEFEATMLGHLEDVMRYARSLARDPADADDLVQETFLRAFRAWHTFDQASDARRWLFAICRHAFLRTRHRESRMVTIDGEAELEALAAVAQHKAARAEGLEELFTRIDLGPAVARALADLSDAHRVVVVMVDIEGHGYGDVAAELGVPIGTVRSRLFRARRQLQGALIAFARDAGFATGAPSPKETSP